MIFLLWENMEIAIYSEHEKYILCVWTFYLEIRCFKNLILLLKIGNCMHSADIGYFISFSKNVQRAYVTLKHMRLSVLKGLVSHQQKGVSDAGARSSLFASFGLIYNNRYHMWGSSTSFSKYTGNQELSIILSRSREESNGGDIFPQFKHTYTNVIYSNKIMNLLI